ncbi:MAG: MBOAT family protein [Planctomycetaceae bacterium]|nr:MBOAT family protein [Planctomycetaceae bacterium]
MLFNSFSFWLFYLTVFLLYFQLKRRGQNVLLLIASYFFYGCWDWRFLSLIAVSTVIDYTIGLNLSRSENPTRRKWLLATSIVANLGILGFFKYYGFFATELDRLFTVVGVPAMLPTLSIILPVGISFYTFQTMSYTIDVYRGDCKATNDLLDFAVYVSFFPQLVAGPIERANRFLPQVQNVRHPTSEQFKQGLFLILIGLFRKVVIADNMAPIVNTIFATPTAELSGAEILLGIYAFAFQIYGDFSGYSAIARGVASWLGFDLMTNFQMPYFAISPSDFWRRWHISLSQWLRDYLYIPLGGNRGQSWYVYRNLMLTMVIGGFWHGAAWTFIVWGFFHGAILCAYRPFESKETFRRLSESPLSWERLFRMVVMFHLVCVSWLLFRAESMTQVWEMTARMATDLTVTPFAVSIFALMAFFVMPLLLFESWLEWRNDLMRLVESHWLMRGLVYLYIVYMMIFFPPPIPSEFIYFQF